MTATLAFVATAGFLALSRHAGADPYWPVHEIDGRYRGANGLGAGDVNADGYTDYVTNYEFDQRYVISLHPGPGADPRAPWPTVDVWTPRPLAIDTGVNPESSALGDFDGDGNTDVVGVQGWSEWFIRWWEGGGFPGIRFFWGPSPSDVTEPASWTDSGRIPTSIDRGHFHWVTSHDVNEDGLLDVTAGGRVHGGNYERGGIVWLEAPTNPAERRDLDLWKIHQIAPDQYSGHGFVWTDVDEDGDADIADANADFDTPQTEEKVLWYENPGPGPAQGLPWTQHVIWTDSSFWAKPSMTAADLDQDGHTDLLTQTRTAIHWFRKTSVNPVAWDHVEIHKDPSTTWRSRPVRVADMDGDGHLDIVGMLIHEYGDLPGRKASVFWMSYSGPTPGADNWTTHTIKWGPGRVMLVNEFGEKWDQVDITDVDSDGDLDIVANNEEWWEDDDSEFVPFFHPQVDPSSVSVVWFENRLAETEWSCIETAGTCDLQAEQPVRLGDGTWIERGSVPGADGNYLMAHNALPPWVDNLVSILKRAATGDANLYALGWGDTSGATWKMDLAGGTYDIWVRRRVPPDWGYGLGGSRSDGLLLGVDSTPGRRVDDLGRAGSWTWVQAMTVDLTAGSHELHARVRERGYMLDRVVVTSDTGWVPPAG